jgi:hypothetical protein
MILLLPIRRLWIAVALAGALVVPSLMAQTATRGGKPAQPAPAPRAQQQPQQQRQQHQQQQWQHLQQQQQQQCSCSLRICPIRPQPLHIHLIRTRPPLAHTRIRARIQSHLPLETSNPHPP